MPPPTRIGDLGSHGGQVVTGHDRYFNEGPQMSRIGDIYACPIHGPNPIVSGSPDGFHAVTNTSRITSMTACGAIIVTGASKSEYR